MKRGKGSWYEQLIMTFIPAIWQVQSIKNEQTNKQKETKKPNSKSKSYIKPSSAFENTFLFFPV